MSSSLRARGFALVDALAALAILSLSLACFLHVSAEEARRSSRAESLRAATLVAESALASAGTLYPLERGTVSGAEGPFSWWVECAPYGDGTKSRAGTLWLVTAGVKPLRGGAPLIVLRSVRLATSA